MFNSSSVYSEEMFPPTPIPTFNMENSNHDPVTMASTISRARLEALASLSEGDYDKFLELGKHCIDAHAQATKTMMNDVAERIDAGEEFDWKTEIENLRDGLYRYCQAIVEEAESLAPQEHGSSVKSASISPRYSTTLTKSSSNSTKNSTDSSNGLTTPSTFLSNPKTPASFFSDPKTPSSLTMSDGSSESHLVSKWAIFRLVCSSFHDFESD